MSVKYTNKQSQVFINAVSSMQAGGGSKGRTVNSSTFFSSGCLNNEKKQESLSVAGILTTTLRNYSSSCQGGIGSLLPDPVLPGLIIGGLRMEPIS